MFSEVKQLGQKLLGLRGVAKPTAIAIERMGVCSAPRRLLVIANSVMPTVQLGIVQPLRELVSDGLVSIEFLTEEQLKRCFGGAARGKGAAAWFKQRLAQSCATEMVLCRYSGPFATEAIEFARAQSIAALYVIDDDLLNVPREIGQAKFAYHNHPLRLDAVRYLLKECDVVYCSNERLARRLEELRIVREFYVGSLFCAGGVLQAPREGQALTLGYMGFDHDHDFQVALPAVVRLLRNNPHLKFELFGRIARPHELAEFGDRVIELSVVPDYEAFLTTLAARRWDIGICPLAHTPFNEVKNINKWIEYTSVGTAVVATQGLIYDACCADGCGWLADDGDWDEALQALAADPVLRLRQVQAAQRKLEQNYSVKALRTQLLDVVARATASARRNRHVKKETPRGRGNKITVKEQNVMKWKNIIQRDTARSDQASNVVAKMRESASVAFDGFTEHQVQSGYVEMLSDDDLNRLNDLLPWMCFTSDTRGRRFGNIAWKGKRETPQVVPDPRIEQMDKAFGLKGRFVLEVGCFEGVHTIALAQCGAEVTAVDSRIENVVKTVVRCNLFGHKPTCFVSDIEKDEDMARLPQVDFVHHVGVLYHLKDPITHLKRLAAITSSGFLLDTHYAKPDMLNCAYHVDDREYRYFHYREKGREEVFSGMYDHAKWLLLDDLKALLAELGFSKFQMLNDEQQRNGPRLTALISR
jgi:2-polyprenyl-3-methyl-5-hydroxy-6-metoxy-1,4-benzoquinol methylase